MCAGILSLWARSWAAANVCSSDWETIFQIFPCFWQEAQQIGGHEAFFADLLRGEITRKPMEIDCQTKSFDKRSEMLLSENARDHSGKDVPRTPGCHSGIACGIEVNTLVGCRHHGAIAFKNDIGIP